MLDPFLGSFRIDDIAVYRLSQISAGDFDADGDVDDVDLANLQANFGMTSLAGQFRGDADGDGDIDGKDFITWQRGYTGNLSAPLSNAAAVPEPAAWLIGMFGFAATATCIRLSFRPDAVLIPCSNDPAQGPSSVTDLGFPRLVFRRRVIRRLVIRRLVIPCWDTMPGRFAVSMRIHRTVARKSRLDAKAGQHPSL